jgi:transcriptional regulator with XRE-family HTH domain
VTWEPNLETDYGKAFRVVRAAHGWQQADMAERLGISSSALSLIEAGKRKPSVKVIEKLARVVNIPSALIVLLASDETDVDDENIQALGGALLKLLVSAGDKQRPLPLAGDK